MSNAKIYLAESYVSQSWMRTLTFYTLVSNKIHRGNLPGALPEYKFALIDQFRKKELEIRNWIGTENRGGDRKKYKQPKIKPVYSRREYDDEAREIIKAIQSKYN